MELIPDCALESPEGWIKPRLLGPTQNGDLGWNPRISISNKFPGDAAGPGLPLRMTDTEKRVQEDSLHGLSQEHRPSSVGRSSLEGRGSEQSCREGGGSSQRVPADVSQ